MSQSAVLPETGKSFDRKAYLFIGVLSSVLNAVLLVAPVVAGKLVERYELSPVQVGGLFSLELAAFSLASVPAYLWLRRANLQYATYALLGITIAGNIASGLVGSFAALMIARFVTALAAGSIIVLLLSVSGVTSNRGRAFGVFTVSQLAMGALILAVFPIAFASVGVEAIYWTIAALAAACLLVVRAVPGDALRRDSAPRGETAERPPMRRIVVPLVLGMLAVFLFYFALSGVWTFMGSIAEGAGLDLSATSVVLSIATVAGIASALTATLIGDTKRRTLLLLVGYVGMAASIAMLLGLQSLFVFAAAAIVFKFAWTLILPYLLSLVSEIRWVYVMSTINIVMGAGFATGPVSSGALIESSGGFTSMLVVALVSILVSLFVMLLLRRSQGEGGRT